MINDASSSPCETQAGRENRAILGQHGTPQDGVRGLVSTAAKTALRAVKSLESHAEPSHASHPISVLRTRPLGTPGCGGTKLCPPV